MIKGEQAAVSVMERHVDDMTARLIIRKSTYPSASPVSMNISAAEGKWKDSMSRILTRVQAILPQAYLVEIEDATVFGQGNIRDRTGMILSESITNQPGPLPDFVPAQTQIDELSVLLRKPGDSNFGHWLIELCPRIREFASVYSGTDWKVAIPSRAASMRPLRARTLEWLGIEPSRIIWLENDPVRFRRLAFITSNSIHSHTHDYDGVHYLRENALRFTEPEARRRRIFIARAPSLRRQLLNEAAVRGILERHRFEIVFSEQMSIDDQVRLFSNAECVVGVSGAGLTNIVFAPRDCKILSLNPAVGQEFFFWDIANIVGQSFSFIFGAPEDASLLGHSNFWIDQGLLIAWLRDNGIQ